MDNEINKYNEVRGCGCALAFLSVIAIIISVIALALVDPRSLKIDEWGEIDLDVDYLGVIIGLLALMVTLMVGWQIWQTINTSKFVEKYDERIRTLERNNTEVGTIFSSLTGLVEAQRIVGNILSDNNRTRAHEYARAYLYACDSLLELVKCKMNIEGVIERCLALMNQIIVNSQGILNNTEIPMAVREQLHQEFVELDGMINNLVTIISNSVNENQRQRLSTLHQIRQTIIGWDRSQSNRQHPDETVSRED